MKYFITAILLFAIHSGNAQLLKRADQLGGTLHDHAYAIARDANGNIYTTGSFEGFADFDPGPGFTALLSAGDADVYVTKQAPDGQLLWAIHFGGMTEDYGEALAVDDAGNVYVTGYFNGTADFDPGSGTFTLTSAGDYDAFVARYDADGQFSWAGQIGGTGSDQIRDMSLDTAGNILICGSFMGTADLDPGAGQNNATSAGGNDMFITKLKGNGIFLWAHAFGDTGNDMARGITVDAENNILTTGRFAERVDFDPGAPIANLTSNGMEDAFVSKLTSDGDYLWAVHFGSDLMDEGTAIHTDTSGHVYTTGFFQNTADFDPGAETTDLVAVGAEDIFISVLDEDGSFILSGQLGGAGTEKPHAIATDTAGNIYTSGYFAEEADFDPDTSSFILSSAGGFDVFISKLNAEGNFKWAGQLGGPGNDRCLDMTVGDSALIYTTGQFEGTADFDPSPGESSLTSFGFTDIFVVTLEPCYPKSSDVTIEACESYTSPDGLEVWTESGTYMDTLALYGGCDSVITIHLTILENTSWETSLTACDSYTSPDGLELWTMSGTYLDTIPNSAGCDSLITIHLTIVQSTSSEITVTACDSYLSPDGQETWTSSGTYMDVVPNAVGCDSTITVFLTINNSSASTITAEACESYTSPDGLEIWTESGTYFDTLVNSSGCDSIITIELTIFNNTSSAITADACESYTSPSGLYVWTDSGTYFDTIPNAAGCDSLMTIELTIHLPTADTLDVTACDSLVSPSGQVWTLSGTYQDTIPNAAGCDSVMTINLTIINSTSAEITETSCDSYTSPSGHFTWTESGIYLDTLPNAAGCDSIITINLTINISPSLEITVEACDSYLSPTGAETWTESGIYQEIIPLAGACDSIITVNLTIHHSAASEVTVTACESYLSPDGTETWTESGTYMDTIPTTDGCDSVITILLTITNHTASEINVTACDSYMSPDGTETWTESGTYTDTIPNAAGCDSVMTVNLTLQTTPMTEITVEACDRYTHPGSGETWTESGTYQVNITGGGICDSIVIVNLTIHNSSASDLTASACESFLSPSTNYQWTESGIYLDTIPNAAGCDSVITIDLTVIHIDTAIVQAENVLTAAMDGATYQWIDCDNGNQPIDGETGQQFTATANGNYAVIISMGGCSGTSECYSVTTVATKDILAYNDLKLYPNPARDYVVIEPGRQLGVGLITVSDLQGRELYRTNYRGEQSISVPMDGPSGLYIVTLKGEDYLFMGKVMME